MVYIMTGGATSRLELADRSARWPGKSSTWKSDMVVPDATVVLLAIAYGGSNKILC